MGDRPPIERLLDDLVWEEIPPMPGQRLDTVPYATHRGFLRVFDFEFAVFQLNDGQRVISEESMVRWLSQLVPRDESPETKAGTEDSA